MAKIKRRCRRGHDKFEQGNFSFSFAHGKIYRRCLVCARAYENLKYRNNAEFRERCKAATKRRREMNKRLGQQERDELCGQTTTVSQR